MSVEGGGENVLLCCAVLYLAWVTHLLMYFWGGSERQGARPTKAFAIAIASAQ